MEEEHADVTVTILEDLQIEVRVDGISKLPFKSSQLLEHRNLDLWASSRSFKVNSTKFKFYSAREPTDDSVVLVLLQSLPRKGFTESSTVSSLVRYPDLPAKKAVTAISREDSFKLLLNISTSSLGKLYLRSYSGPLLMVKVKLLEPNDYKFLHKLLSASNRTIQ